MGQNRLANQRVLDVRRGGDELQLCVLDEVVLGEGRIDPDVDVLVDRCGDDRGPEATVVAG